MMGRISAVQLVIAIAMGTGAWMPSFVAAQDCNNNGIPDATDIADCPSGDPDCTDCNTNGIPDGCELPGAVADVHPTPAISTNGFGVGLAIDGEFAVVGSPFENGIGAAYVFRNVAGTWQQVARLTGSQAVSGDMFGYSVAIDSDCIVVGAPATYGNAAGSIFVFRNIAGDWTQEARVVPADLASGDELGSSVDVEGDRLIAASPGNDEIYSNAGAAYVFDRVAGIWQENAKLLPPSGAVASGGHTSVRLAGDFAFMASSYGRDEATNVRTGAVFVYEYTTGDWQQTVRLTPSDGASYDWFGEAVAVDGDTMVVGAPFHDDGFLGYGAAYIFRRIAGAWQEVARLQGVGPRVSEYFGGNIAIVGDLILVGPLSDGEEFYGEPAIYGFREIAGAYRQTMRMQSPVATQYDGFGAAMAATGTFAMIATPYWGDGGYVDVYHLDSAATDCAGDRVLDECRPDCNGNGYPDKCEIELGLSADCNNNEIPDECELTAGTAEDCNADGIPDTCTLARSLPLQLQKILGTGTNFSDQFGDSVAIDGDTAVIGAQSDEFGINSGSVRVFRRINDLWEQVAYFTGDAPQSQDDFGSAVAIDAGTIVVGANGEDDAGANSGVAYVFEEIGGQWQRTMILRPDDPQANAEFGTSVDIDGDVIFVGAPNYDGDASNSGAAYVFLRTAGMWQQVARFVPAVGTYAGSVGRSVAVDGDTAVVGAYTDSEGEPSAGAAYILRNNNGVWQQVDKIFASPQQSGANFGSSVAIDGGNVVVGSYGYVGFGQYSGAAYVFSEGNGVWRQIAMLQPQNISVSWYFGYSVAIEGDRIVVGARYGETDGEWTGLAFAFRRLDDTWVQAGTVRSTDIARSDDFGESVAISATSLLVGAPGHGDLDPDSGSAYVFDLAVLADDCNGNDVIDDCESINSIGAFVVALLSASQDVVDLCLFDLNRDGLIDGHDVEAYTVSLIHP